MFSALLLSFIPSVAPTEPAHPLLALSTAQDKQGKAGEEKAPALADNRPEIKAMLVEFEKYIAAKGKQDDDAIKLVDKLLADWANCGPKDRTAIVSSLAKSFGQRRIPVGENFDDPEKPVEEDEKIYRLYLAVATAWSRMGPESVKPLQKVIGDRTHKANIKLQRRCILSLGKTKDPGSVSLLLDLVNNKDNVIVASACEALGEFNELVLDKRKEIFEKLLNVIMALKVEVEQNQANNSPDPVRSDRYQTISGPILATLQRLSGHEERDPVQFQKWWNDHKKAAWPVG